MSKRISRADYRRWHDQNFYFMVRTLLPGGHVKGHNWICRNPAREDKKPGSFMVAVSGPRRGCWKDFATGDGGPDVISLMAYTKGQDPKSKEVRRAIYKFIIENLI